jgi:CelD/BcsL family acetyltransferase involved in cellulose biosynthesis
MYPRSVIAPALDTEPACPGPATAIGRPAASVGGSLRAERRALDAIPQATWDRLAASNPWSTPFSDWAFHRAWWDAYGLNAHQETLVFLGSNDSSEIVGIVPLMHRHEVEPGDDLVHTTLRHGTATDLTPVPPTATAIFFGASYHADYATMFAAPDDLGRVAVAFVDYLVARNARDWDVVDLRRLRCGDPAAEALAAAFGAREIANGWTLNVEREDVCPVVTLPDGADLDGFLATLGKKDRHEIRRKVRRAEAVGEVVLTDSTDPLDDLEAFIVLHQKRWGVDGLFPDTPGGDQSRVLFRRLFEAYGTHGALRLTFLTVAGKRIAAGVHLETADGYLYYNAGVDLGARDLSPGVLMVYRYVERAIATGRHRLDFLRGDEPYKYAWGARNEPIQRLLVRRRDV